MPRGRPPSAKTLVDRQLGRNIKQESIPAGDSFILPNYSGIEEHNKKGESVYGEIYVKDNTNAITLNSTAKVQITNFAINGVSNKTTPNHTQNHITILKAGIYKVNVSVHINNNAAQTHTVDVSLFKNNGTTEFNNVHAHRTLTGGSGDIGSMSMSGLIDVATDDTIEVWADTSIAADRSVTFEDINLNITQIAE